MKNSIQARKISHRKPANSGIEGHSVKKRGGRPTAAEAELKALHLKNVAADVFVKQGFERASLSEIARRAGVSKDTLYAQYANKSDLFVAVMVSHLETAFVHFAFLLEDRNSLQKCMTDFAFRLLTAMLGPYQSFIHLVFAESQRFPELGKLFWEKAHLRGYDDLAVYFRKQIEMGRLRDDDPHQMARHFLSLLTFDVIIQSLLNVERSMSESRRRVLTKNSVACFLRIYGIS